MQGTNRILVLRLRGGCCSQVEQPFWKSLFLLSWFRLEPLSYGGGCDDPASSGGWESYLSLYYRCPAGVASSFVIGNTWVCYYKSTAHGFHGRFRERERSRGNLAPYCSSWAMIIAPYLLRYNIPSTALACIHTLQPY